MERWRGRVCAYDWATYRQLFTPKLVTTLREGYSLDSLRHDAIAGLTVAILALPLSMAIAIGAGVPPDKGLITAVIAGVVISALGGVVSKSEDPPQPSLSSSPRSSRSMAPTD